MQTSHLCLDQAPGLLQHTTSCSWITATHNCTYLDYCNTQLHVPGLLQHTTSCTWITASHNCIYLDYCNTQLHVLGLLQHTTACTWITATHNCLYLDYCNTQLHFLLSFCLKTLSQRELEATKLGYDPRRPDN